MPDAAAGARYITLTSCSPMYSIAERIVAYGVFESFTPARGRCAPASLHRRSDRLMYGALWRVLPGPWWMRVLILLVLVAAVLYGLFFYVFPWVSEYRQPAGSHRRVSAR